MCDWPPILEAYAAKLQAATASSAGANKSTTSTALPASQATKQGTVIYAFTAAPTLPSAPTMAQVPAVMAQPSDTIALAQLPMATAQIPGSTKLPSSLGIAPSQGMASTHATQAVVQLRTIPQTMHTTAGPSVSEIVPVSKDWGGYRIPRRAQEEARYQYAIRRAKRYTEHTHAMSDSETVDYGAEDYEDEEFDLSYGLDDSDYSEANPQQFRQPSDEENWILPPVAIPQVLPVQAQPATVPQHLMVPASVPPSVPAPQAVPAIQPVAPLAQAPQATSSNQGLLQGYL